MTTTGNGNPPSLTFQNTQIKEVKPHKHLKLTFLSDLKWTHNINEVQIKANKKNILKNLKLKLDCQSIETIFISFIRPALEYADCTWSGTYEIDLSKLDKIQIDAMWIVSGAVACSNLNNLYEELGWPRLGQRRIQHTLSMFYKISYGEALLQS